MATTSKAATCKPKKRRRTKVSKTDGLSNLDAGESHVISDEEVEAIINEKEATVKKASKKESSEKKEHNPLQALSPYEFQITISVLPSIQNMKHVVGKLEQDLTDNKNEEIPQSIGKLQELVAGAEMGIWNSMAKKFVYDTLEQAQENGVKLSIKSGHFVQASDA